MTANTLFKSEAEYNAAIERTIQLFDAAPDTAEFDELELLLVLVKDYEDKHYLIPEPVEIRSVKTKEKSDTHQVNLQVTVDSETFVLKDIAAIGIIQKLKEDLRELAPKQA